MLLVQVPYFRIRTSYGLENLHQCGKAVETNCQKVLWANSTFVEIPGEKLVTGAFLTPLSLTC